MSISGLTEKIRESGKQRTHADRMKLLKKAQILDASGNMDKRFFPSNSDGSKTPKPKS